MGIRGSLSAAWRRRRAGLAPHEFEVRMYLPNQTPAMGVIQGVPHVVTPTPTSRCARDDCGRPQSDPIHRLPAD
jgi:hypothetical protein